MCKSCGAKWTLVRRGWQVLQLWRAFSLNNLSPFFSSAHCKAFSANFIVVCVCVYARPVVGTVHILFFLGGGSMQYSKSFPHGKGLGESAV